MKSKFNILFEQVMNVILESRKDDYIASLKSKGMDESIADELVSMNNPKKEKAALYWILKGTLILPEDQDKVDQAFNLIEKQHLDFQQFEGPMFVINRKDKSTQRINAQSQTFDPDKEPTLKDRKDLGDGVVVYTVDNTKKGQIAVRKAIDVNWGYDKNPWCLAARKNGFDQNEIETLSDEQAEKLGIYSDDVLAVAWKYWKNYSAYPKRIAFKSGQLLAFSAGDEKQHVEWWDRNDKAHYIIPGSNVKDDIEFLEKYGKLNLLDSKNISPEMLEELVDDKFSNVREGVAKNSNTPAEVLRKLAKDKSWRVRHEVVTNTNTPAEILMKLADDKDWIIRMGIAKNPSTPTEILMKLADDKDWNVRMGVAKNSSTPAEILLKLANDRNWNVREGVAMNSGTPAEILRKLAEDENKSVRYVVIRNPSIPIEILRKLAEDEDADVREGIAKNPSTPAEILRKLAEDKAWNVRFKVAWNSNTPAEILMKLVEDEDKSVRESAKSQLRHLNQ